VLFWAGALLVLLGGVRVLMHAFNTHLGWGIACLVLPALLLFFGFTHWELAKKPTLAMVLGLGLMLASVKYV
jgi:hypothetical protein